MIFLFLHGFGALLGNGGHVFTMAHITNGKHSIDECIFSLVDVHDRIIFPPKTDSGNADESK